MNPDWQIFMATQGAQFQDGIVADFGDAAAERIAVREGTVLCDLAQFGLLKVSGEDAQTFLQNLLSNDVREVNGSRAQLSSFNNAKGRMLASMLVWKTAEDYFLQLPRDLCENVRKKLSMYVLRAKVKISDVSHEFVCFGLSGAIAEAALQKVYPNLPQNAMEVSQHEMDTVLRRDTQRFQITTTPARAATLWATLCNSAKPAGAACWDGLDIRAGVPFVLPATQETFVPQMLNFEVIGGVNFKKGCYPGQEVVARMHYLGTPKKRMYLAHIAGDVSPKSGDELFSEGLDGQSCGTVVNSAAAASGGFDLLVVVQTASRASSPVHLGSLLGTTLQFQALPYPLP